MDHYYLNIIRTLKEKVALKKGRRGGLDGSIGGGRAFSRRRKYFRDGVFEFF